MTTLFDDDLVEASVVLAATGRLAGVTHLEVQQFHAARESCYGVPDADARTRAFARVHLDWFGRWGLRRRLDAAAERLPGLSGNLEALVFRRSRGRHDEGAELYRDSEGRARGVVALRADRLVTEPALAGFLLHELAHLEDMVLPGFGYSAEISAPGRTASQERLIRERYRLLWAIRTDGRLQRQALPLLGDRDRRRREFGAAFGFLPEPRFSEVFDSLWTGTIARHAELLELAADPRQLGGCHDPVPGAVCPLCGFPAFRWAEPSSLRPKARERMASEFPGWDAAGSVCARCAEIYEAVTGQEYPATVCL